MRRFTSLSFSLLCTVALVACGDDTADTTSTTSGGGGEGGSSAETTTTGDTTSSTGDSTTTTTTSQGGGSTTSTGGGGQGGGGDLCGNGEDDPGEECDDGNDVDEDGCSSECVLEVVAGCGNGVVELDLDEACDDGNDFAWDGCENDCTASPEEVVCDDLAPLPSGGCDVDEGSAAKLLIGDVLLPHTVLRGGQVSVDASGEITCVGCDCAAIEPGATTVTCPEGAISPGLINTHEHITYAQNDPAPDTGERYEHRHHWRRGLGGHTEIPASPAPDGAPRTAAVRWGELRFLLSGATSLVGSGTGAGFLRNLDKETKEGLDVPSVHFEVFPLSDSGGDMLTSGCGYEDIDSQQSIEADLSYLPHVSEGINAAARNEFICVSGSPGEDLLQHQSSFIHGVGMNAEDYRDMAADGTSLIWSPRSNVVLYGNTAQATIAARAGVNIALGTDWVISGSANMFRELQCAALLSDDYFDGFFTRRDLWKMVTGNAAQSLGLEKVLGTLREGLVADIAIYDASTLDAHAAIVDGAMDGVHLVLRGGEPLYGDTSILDALPDTPAGCEEPFDTCMAEKTVCVQAETGQTLEQLRSSAGAQYGAFFCDEPPGEPTCVPFRGDAVNGSTVYSGDLTAGDTDGDGIANASDNCPTVFNPVRPMDDGDQPDADGDDLGDPCDPCPLEADVTDCVAIDPADEDSDGHPNRTDNCPFDANVTQADSDDDGKGNACDACADAANPGFMECPAAPATIYDVKTGVATGDVFLEDVLVTACVPTRGFFVQHVEGDAAYAGAENSGLYVFNPDTECGTTVAVGDRLDISGEISVFFDQIQLGFAEFQRIGQDALPEPTVVTAAVASGTDPNGWEAVYVRVEDVTVTNPSPAPMEGDPAPTGEFEVEGTLRVDNFIYTSLPIPAQGATFASITGVLMFQRGNQKLQPRSAADLVE